MDFMQQLERGKVESEKLQSRVPVLFPEEKKHNKTTTLFHFDDDST